MNSPNSNPGPDIEVGFFHPHAIFGDGNFNSTTPNFGSFQVDPVPETGTSLLMGLGILSLILLGRSRRKGEFRLAWRRELANAD